MTIKGWFNQLLDLSIVFSFDRSGYKRHCPAVLKTVNLSGLRGIVTGAGSGIGLAAAKGLVERGMQCQLIGRNLEKLEKNFKKDPFNPLAACNCLDMADLKKVYSFAKNEATAPVDLLIHNAGAMPNDLAITKDGLEQMFASQVLGPFIFTKTLADLDKLSPRCRIIFVSSGGMYLQKLDLSDLHFKTRPYNKYKGYANAKRAQVILAELFSKRYPQYLFSSMHPGWADTPGIEESMPFFKKLLHKRFRSAEEGADTILWLATAPDYPSGKFWFDRKPAKTTILNFYKSSDEEAELLWKYCESIFDSIKSLPA